MNNRTHKPAGHLVHPQYREDIDGLRAIAILFVVAYHALPKYVSGGFVGVDVFFVISGFLISSIILQSLDLGVFSFSEFYGRRIRRIFPALLLVLASCYGFGWLALRGDEFKQLGMNICAGAGFVANLVLWSESGYFDAAAESKPLLHLWSLGVEEQFYIVWPLLLYLAARRNFNLLVLTLFLLATSYLLNIHYAGIDSTGTFYSPVTRFWELLIGSVLAYWDLFFKRTAMVDPGKMTMALQRITRWRALLKDRAIVMDGASWIGFVLIASSALVLTRSNLFPGWWALLPTLGTFLMIGAGREAWLNKAILTHPVLVLIGLVSFPLYLWHWPVLAFLRIVESGEVDITLRVAAVVASFFLAWLTYRFIERPIRRRADSLVIVSVLVILMLLAGYAGFNAYKRDGLPFRVAHYAERQIDIADFETYRKNVVPCGYSDSRLNSLSWCLKSRQGAVTNAVWGDSHADHLFPGISGQGKDNWLLLGRSSCPPILGVKSYKNGETDNVCLDANNFAINALSEDASIRTVVLASLGPFYISSAGYAAQHSGDLDPSNWNLVDADPSVVSGSKAEAFFLGMSRSITALEAAGKRVILYQDIPEMPFMAAACVGRPFAITAKRCGLDRLAVVQRQAEYRSILQRLRSLHPNVHIFEPDKYLCDEKFCFAGKDGIIYYRDSHHLSIRGSNYLAEQFFKWMAELDRSS